MLLPVIALALVGLASIRKDRALVLQEARESAAASAQQFADLLRGSFQSRLVMIYLEALQVDSTNLPPGTRISRDGWEVALPEYQNLLASLPENRRALAAWVGGLRWVESTDGRLLWPPPYPLAPTPAVNVPQAWRDAQANELDGRMAEALSEYRMLATNSTEARTETGIPLQPVAAYRWLQLARQSATGEVVTAASVLASNAFCEPSILSPIFLREATAAHAPESGSFGYQQSPPGLLANWEIAEDGRAWHEHWHTTLPPGSIAQPGVPIWSRYQGSDWLVVPLTVLGQREETNQVDQLGYQLLPELLLRATVREHLGAPQFRLPPFAAIQVAVNGRNLLTVPGETLAETSIDLDISPLETTFAKYETSRARLHFTVRVLLADREGLFALQRQRARWFLGLIAGACGVAVLGVGMTGYAFQRQLRLNEMKSNFVSSVSHELRAPIASVRLLAESLERGKVSEPMKQNEYFRFIGQECRRLSALVENVLDFSRIEQGRKQYEFEPTDIYSLVEQTVKLMDSYAAERDVRIDLNAERGAQNAELIVDGRAIQQALVNLIDNAIKHSPKDTVVTVKVETRGAGRPGDINHRPSTVNLSVSDHGPGIPASEHQKIFERFYRLGSELRRETQGVGIGLSIVKHIVDAHGGRVRVESEVGNGSRFTIELPAEISTADKLR